MTATQAPPGDAPAGGPAAGGAPAGGPPGAGDVARRRWRRSRGILFAILALVILGVLLAALRPRAGQGYLDPDSAGRQGSRALVEIVRRNGTPVTIVHSASAAAELMRGRPDAVLVIARSERLLPADLRALRAAPGDRLLITPSDDTLTSLAPGVEPAGSAWSTPQPGCALPAAASAGDVDFSDSQVYTAPAAATKCYLTSGEPGLVQLDENGSTVTVVGSGRPFTNQYLTGAGNAALAMNLVGARSSAVWLMPDLPPPGSGAHKSFTDLVPFGVKLAVLQAVVAVVLVALWRARRLGPIVAEPLPVIVRSAEAVEGRARLYRSRQATGHAARALRAGALERLTRLLGLPASAATDPGMAAEIVRGIAAHTGRQEAEIGAALYGPPPSDDAGLVGLAGFLDDLERKVRNS